MDDNTVNRDILGLKYDPGLMAGIYSNSSRQRPFNLISSNLHIYSNLIQLI